MHNDTASFLPYGRQSIDDDDIQAVADVLRSDYLTTGPAVERFEQALAQAVDAPEAIAVSSGTAALHVAMLALGVGPGDFVIVPAITFVASANAALLCGAEVHFADVDADSGLTDCAALEKAVQSCPKKPKLIVLVHLAGQTEDLPKLHQFASSQGIPILEDACHALGTHYEHDGQSYAVGSCHHSTAAIFSFHPVKTVAMGEGGAITTRDAQLAEAMRRYRSHGIIREDFENPHRAVNASGEAHPWYYEMVTLGLNYRASDIQCALGYSQLQKLDDFVTRRQQLVAGYDAKFQCLAPVLRPLKHLPGCQPGWHLYVVLIDFDALGLTRDQVMQALRQHQIGSQVHYIPVPWQPYYEKRYTAGQSYPGAASYYERTLSLPLYPTMSDADVDRVVDALTQTLRG